MAYTFTDRDGKTILHSWGRFRATVLADVVVGDLLGLYATGATLSVQLANEAATAVAAGAVACQDIAAGKTGWCALAAELKAPTTIATGGVATQTYFDDGTSMDIGQPLYLSDAGKMSSTVGGTTAQQVGFSVARDRIVIVPGTLLTAAIDCTTITASGVVSLTDILGVTGVATFTAQDVHSGGLTCADTKPMIGGTLATPKLTVTAKTSGAGYTITAAELLGGFISDTSATGAIAATLPTVASVVALLPGYVVGTSFRFIYKNLGDQTVTLTTGATWTMTGTMTIAATKYREFIFRITGATTGVCYALMTGDY